MPRQVYLGGMPVEDARRAFLDAVSAGRAGPTGPGGRRGLTAAEAVETVGAVGRVTAGPVRAALSNPHYPAAAMDGIAVRARDTFGAGDLAPVRLLRGEGFWPIDTGDPLPAGCDAVVMIEDVRRAAGPGEGDAERVELLAPAVPWQHVRAVGEDIVAGEVVLPRGHAIRPVDVGALLAAGVARVTVRRRPRVAILATGDELLRLAPGAAPAIAPGQIIDSNSFMLAGLVRADGGDPVVGAIIPDRPEAVAAAIAHSAAQSDVVLVNAGSAAGDGDFVPRAIADRGRLLAHGLALRPGKPAALGIVDGTPVVGLPGYPASTFTVYRLVVQPLLRLLLGQPPPARQFARATLARAIVSPMGVAEVVRARLGRVNGRLLAQPLPRGAALTTSLVRADGLIHVPPSSEGLDAGGEVEVELLRPLAEVEGALLCVGSHDIALDVLDDLLRARHPGATLASANVGSLGGLSALARGEAHLAGSHLLDTASGEFNVPFVKQHLKGRRVALVAVADRRQGLIVPAANPLGIAGVGDLARPGVRFINRQRGSGTRLLLDALLAREHVAPAAVEGYEREEYTHFGVAAAVKSGAADCGLGIHAAARALGLGFLPLAAERYELVIPGENWDDARVRALVEVLRSAEFRDRVAGLGGYDVAVTGEERWVG